MTLPGAGFGLRVQGPNVQRMVVSALASTGPSFGWGKMAFVSSELVCPSFFLSCESFSEKRTFGNRLFWHHPGWFRLKFSTRQLKFLVHRMSADLHFIGCHAFDGSFGWLFSVEADFSEKSFPPKCLR